MALERTLSIVKPDGVKKNVIGKVVSMFEEKNLKIVAAKMMVMTKNEAEGFYAVHRQRPFFGELVQFMTSGPVLVMVLEGEDAIAKNREIMGATDPAKADAGTIRKLHGSNVGENAVHGSDSADNAKIEIAYFFPANEVAPVAG